MEPLKLSQTVEENLIEMFAWIYLFPITLLDLIIHPLQFLERMSEEMLKVDGPRFDTRMPPVLFLLFATIPLSIAIVKLDKDVTSMPAVADAALLLALTISLFPFIWSLLILAVAKRNFSRSAFRAAFSSQCYVFCPLWLFILLGTLTLEVEMERLSTTLLLVALAAFIWTLITEWRLLPKASSKGMRIAGFIATLGLSYLGWELVNSLACATNQLWLASTSCSAAK